MRKDMGKVITERPRRGFSGWTAKYGKSIRWEGFDGAYDEPRRAKASAGGQYGWNAKEFTDVLGPIYKYLEKQVGRHWNKIYSEMCGVLDKRKLTHKHVFDHAMDHVERDNVYKGKDGLFYVSTKPYLSRWDSRLKYKPTPIKGLFVDPKTGILRKQSVREKPEPKKPVTEIKRPDGKYYKIINGLWYLCEIKKLDPWEVVGSRPNKYLPDKTEKVYRRDLSPKYWEIIETKRQLGKKELKELGLKNEQRSA